MRHIFLIFLSVSTFTFGCHNNKNEPKKTIKIPEKKKELSWEERILKGTYNRLHNKSNISFEDWKKSVKESKIRPTGENKLNNEVIESISDMKKHFFNHPHVLKYPQQYKSTKFNIFGDQISFINLQKRYAYCGKSRTVSEETGDVSQDTVQIDLLKDNSFKLQRCLNESEHANCYQFSGNFNSNSTEQILHLTDYNPGDVNIHPYQNGVIAFKFVKDNKGDIYFQGIGLTEKKGNGLNKFKSEDSPNHMLGFLELKCKNN